mmetsp:Transcript_3219/g.5571  ORF Transcript_3219/g.5571 Transcript_3219/m.5571 type:complete len:95 (+) Transcript_3219:4-288(+)
MRTHTGFSSGAADQTTSPVNSMLRTVYSVALRLNSWAITPSILALPKATGGLSLAQPRAFLLWQHATPFVISCLTGRDTIVQDQFFELDSNLIL